MHWQYYLSIENMLVKTNQYVAHSNKNKDTYSDEFTSIILLSCSEVDSLLKQLCFNKSIKKSGKYYSMKDYVQAIEKHTDLGLATGIEMINDNVISCFPFENIDSSKPYANLHWWKDYQSIKHDRIKNVAKGNLINAVNSVAAQHIILRILTDFISYSEGQEYIKKEYFSEYWVPFV